MELYAHYDKMSESTQLLSDHLKESSEIAGNDLKYVGMENTAKLAGLIHDIGKGKNSFQSYLFGKSKIKVDHSSIGMIYIMPGSDKKEGIYRELTRELIGFAVSSHHSVNDSGKDFGHIIEKKSDIDYAGAIQNIDDEIKKDADRLFEKAVFETETFIKECKKLINEKFKDASNTQVEQISKYMIGMRARMILSALIDGDYASTSNFFNGKYEDTVSFTDWNEILNNIDKYVLLKNNSFNKINDARKAISDKCEEIGKTEENDSIHCYSAPTGAGKTMSALRYAVAHAAKTNKKKIIWVTPLISVTEQNAEEIRNAVGKDIILEQHSEVTFSSPEKERSFQHFSQNWDSQIVVTTMVQFLNTLFASGGTKIRRMQALTECEIVFDEIQFLSKKMTYMFNMAVNYLSYFCHDNIVLMSATIPKFEKTRYPIMEIKDNLMFCESESFAKYKILFKRNDVYKLNNLNEMSTEDVSEELNNAIKASGSILMVCNTKIIANEIYKSLNKKIDSDMIHLYYMTTNLCQAHRKDVISNISMDLTAGIKVICISTQIMEAGIDLSFQRVYRELSGVDHIIQTAGRCNRNGERENGESFIVKIGNSRVNKEVAQEISSANWALEKENSERSVNLENVINSYYESINKAYEEGTNPNYYAYDTGTDISPRFIFDMLGNGERVEGYRLNQLFNTAWTSFKAIDNENTVQIVVPYKKEGKAVIEYIIHHKSEKLSKQKLREASHYSVNISEHMFRRITEKFGTDDIYRIDDSVDIYVINPENKNIYIDSIGINL